MADAVDQDFGKKYVRFVTRAASRRTRWPSEVHSQSMRCDDRVWSFSPSLKTIRKLASGLNISLRRLFQIVDRGRRSLHDRVCDFLAGRTNAQVARAWRVIRAMFRE